MSKYNDNSDIVTLLDYELPHLEIDKEFAKIVRVFRLSWMSKGDHALFFSGTLLGTHKVVFSHEDEYDLTTRIFGCDIRDIQKKLNNLDDIDPSHSVASNPIYLILVYLIYKTKHSKLSNGDKEELIVNLGLIMLYKMLTSLLSRRFGDYQLDESIAKIAYERLTNKYLSKKFDSWQELLEYYAEELVHNNTVEKKFDKFNTTNATLIVSGVQTKLRGVINNLYSIIIDIRDSKSSMLTIAHTSDTEGGETIDAINNDIETTINLIISKAYDKSFVNDDLLKTFIYFLPKPKQVKYLKQIIEHVSASIVNDDKETIKFLEDSVKITLRYINNKHNGTLPDIETLFISSKNYYSNSRVAPRDAVLLKEYATNLMKKVTGKRTKHLVSLVGVLAIVYIFMLAILNKNK